MFFQTRKQYNLFFSLIQMAPALLLTVDKFSCCTLNYSVTSLPQSGKLFQIDKNVDIDLNQADDFIQTEEIISPRIVSNIANIVLVVIAVVLTSM